MFVATPAGNILAAATQDSIYLPNTTEKRKETANMLRLNQAFLWQVQQLIYLLPENSRSLLMLDSSHLENDINRSRNLTSQVEGKSCPED